MKMLEDCYPDDVTVIKRNEILKYILTKNPKSKRNETVEEHINLIKEHYSTVRWTEDVFHTFHSALMEKEPSKIDDFLEKYTDSSLKGFCKCIKKDIAPVKNVISLEVSSGFAEGNNNKFKLIKRIVYGRTKLANLSKNVFLLLCPR
ncbi:transposase [Lachnospiraceae bacterium 48-33]